MTENEFELDGKVYVAVLYDIPRGSFNLCGECVLKRNSELCEMAPACSWTDNKDHKNRIFMDKLQ